MLTTPHRSRLVAAIAASSLMTLGWVASSSPAYPTVSSDSGFNVLDGDLDTNDTPAFDWNSFASVAWPATPAAPYRIATEKVVSGWTLNGFEDAAVLSSDSVFAGGTKQDDDCGSLKSGPKPPNKDDLERIYLSHATKPVGGSDHIFLNLAWSRIVQNTTSSSAHIGFEFNKATLGNCTGSALKKRVGGDLLVVYDFEGGDADNPTLKLSTWLPVGSSGTCEVGSLPCWGNTLNLTSLGYAEARVNTTSVGSVSDLIAPNAPETQGLNEFGEAGIDLTAAGVFPAGGPCQAFGSAYAVSRSSGSSAQAQMKDIVGPGPISINNCGALRILKKSTKSGNPLVSTAGATFTVDGPDVGTAADFKVVDNTATGDNTLTPVRVGDQISDDSATTTVVEGLGELCVSGLNPGSYTVVETVAPTGYADAPSSQDGQTVTVTTGTNCTTAKPANAASGSFTNAPLADLQVRFRDGGSGETNIVTPSTDLTCVDGAATPPPLGGTADRTGTTGWDDTLTISGIPINPSPRTIVCTIVIDP